MKKEDLIITLNLADTRISEFINSESIISYEPIKVVILDTHVFLEGYIPTAIYAIFSSLFDDVSDSNPITNSNNYEKVFQKNATNFSYEIYEEIDFVKLSAKKAILKAQQAERKVTKDLFSATSECTGNLEGLEFKIKTLDSLFRKMQKEPKAKMRDVLRYTEVSSTKSLFKDYRKTMQFLEKKGYEVTAVKNTWNKIEAVYKGVNTNIKTPEGYEFELQFHTKESFDLKNGKLHELYEKQRILDKKKDFIEWQAIEDEMFSLSSKLQTPNQIERI
ncbi:hypothetical protein [Enterococcus faecalis]|uniref:hypothetical protein n=2 Tax=Enterococcus faecalis TaxID=1351 RepID=UPI000665167F|nr:hypothetical protein [Enterococcus faecalis]EGO2601798.1 hypothetical protein [Enterococcus faecalis]EGO7961115.1 hypothetical protein [Enterococcus faecalis]EGO8967008.1 hypothetical protein [Enterococcus faecalis]EGO9504136.1 hypothetical protein [Enterococcus faecalis]EIM5394301.1 hypothetical protein [Enterococcus faecalis]